MPSFVSDYLLAHQKALESIPQEKVKKLIQLFKEAWQADKQIFVFGNGGSAANASHFVTDLGKGSSDKLPGG